MSLNYMAEGKNNTGVPTVQNQLYDQVNRILNCSYALRNHQWRGLVVYITKLVLMQLP